MVLSYRIYFYCRKEKEKGKEKMIKAKDGDGTPQFNLSEETLESNFQKTRENFFLLLQWNFYQHFQPFEDEKETGLTTFSHEG